jgi:hypothetical protein
MADPKLDLLVVDTHSVYTLGIADLSVYPSGFNIVSPTIQIAPLGVPLATLPFSAGNLNIFNSAHLGLSCDMCPLPDGIYRIKYSVNPAYKNFVEKTIIRVDQIQEKYDDLFLSIDLTQCDLEVKKDMKQELDEIYFFIQQSIAAANKSAASLAVNLLNKANRMIERFQSDNCKTCF